MDDGLWVTPKKRADEALGRGCAALILEIWAASRSSDAGPSWLGVNRDAPQWQPGLAGATETDGNFKFQVALFTSCPFAMPTEYINSPIRLHGSKWPTFSQGLRPRAQQASAPTTEKLFAA